MAEIFVERPQQIGRKRVRKKLWGVGVNDSWYVPEYKGKDGKRLTCPYYSLWRGILGRCYSKDRQEKQPSYRGCTVCQEWLDSFMAFRSWMETQDWEGKQLDKDIIDPSNKTYSPEHCYFVSHKVNNLLGRKRLVKKQGNNLPIGVFKTRSDSRYRVLCNRDSNNKDLGIYSSVGDAFETYINYKEICIKEVIEEEDLHPKLSEGLLGYIDGLKDDLAQIRDGE